MSTSDLWKTTHHKSIHVTQLETIKISVNSNHNVFFFFVLLFNTGAEDMAKRLSTDMALAEDQSSGPSITVTVSPAPMQTTNSSGRSGHFYSHARIHTQIHNN